MKGAIDLVPFIFFDRQRIEFADSVDGINQEAPSQL
jgi:hypothetical protein